MPTVRTISNKRAYAGDLLNVAGHELRSPLTALRVYADLLNRRLPETDELWVCREGAQEITHLIARMDHELEMYTVAGHLARNTFTLVPDRADLQQLVANTASAYARATIGGAIAITGATEPVYRMMDAKRFEMALGMLLMQACIASDEASPSIGVSRLGVVAAVQIADAGPLPEAVALALDLPAHTLPAPDDIATLRVAVAREVIAAHGGSLQAFSEGTGYVVTISLPGILAG
jgi:signal transduction histidine kinase